VTVVAAAILIEKKQKCGICHNLLPGALNLRAY